MMSTLSLTADQHCFRHDPLERLRHLLAGYLVGAEPLRWPGADGMTEEDVLLNYPALALQDRVPGRVELCRRFPDLTPVIGEFFEKAQAGI